MCASVFHVEKTPDVIRANDMSDNRLKANVNVESKENTECYLRPRMNILNVYFKCRKNNTRNICNKIYNYKKEKLFETRL